MNCAQALQATTWGDEVCWLRLPGFNACFSGLSVGQKKQILEDYSCFALDVNQLLEMDNMLVCQAYKLESELEIPIAELERDGQYSPIKTRHLGEIKITGFNFLASFNLNKNNLSESRVSPQQSYNARLGVANENELAMSLVLENFLRIYSAHNALLLSGAILHSAGLVFDAQAYVFVGYSGVGKTTLTRKAHLSGSTVLSDDLNLILPTSDGAGYDAYKVPFTGEFGRTVDHVNTAMSFPVKTVVLLEQAAQINVERTTHSKSISRLLAGSPFVNTDDDEIPALFDVYSKLVTEVPVIKLGVPFDANIDDILSAINLLIDDQ